MSIPREVFFVLMVFAPLVITLPLVASTTIQKVLYSFFQRIFAFIGRPLAPAGEKPKVKENYKFWLIYLIVLFLIQSIHPLSGFTNYWNIVVVTALAFCIYVALSYAHRRTISYACITAIIFSGYVAFILIYPFRDGYSDNNRDTKFYNAMRDTVAHDIRLALITYAADKKFPAGYIEKSSPILTSLPATEEKDIEAKLLEHGYSWKLVHRWHTSITGQYYVDRQKVYLWYPGGKIKDEIDNIRWQKKAGE